MRKSLLILVAVAVLGGGGYAYYKYRQKPVAPTVTAARVTRGDLAEAVGATGTLQAVTTVQVGTRVSGTIQELHADFNSLVRKGQVLARLDPSLFQTQIEQARANLIRAEADLERLRVSLDDARTKHNRAKELWSMKLIPQMELESAEVAVRTAEAQLRSQQAAVTQSTASLQQNEVNLQHTVIESPIDGLVISRNVDVGQTVAASMSAPTLFVLAADLTKMQVLASLDESDVGRIRPGQLVRFRVDAYPNDEFTGSVTQLRLQPTTVQNVVTYQTVIDVPNPQLKLKPGMTATVSIEITRRADVLRVPNTALRFRPSNEVFTALGQTPPPPVGGRGRGAGTGPDTRNTQPGQQPGAGQEAVARERSAQEAPADQRASRGQGPAGTGTAPAGGNGERAATDGASDTRTGRRGGRGNFAERLAAMSPEERERLIERMRARGFTPPQEGQAAGTPPPSRGQGAAAAAQRSPAISGATTFDALFPPLTPTESFGQVWLHVDGKLQRVRLRLGVSDGQQSELLQALDGKLEEGTEVVTNVTTGAAQTPAAPQGNFPGLSPFPGRGNNRGGRGGG